MKGYKISLYIGENHVTTNYAAKIRHANTTPRIRDYCQEKHQWTDKVLNTIDWDAHGKAMQSLSTTMKKTIPQYIHDWLPTSENIKKA